MCVIVYKQAGIKMELKVLEDMWDTNSHGAGFAYHKDGKIIVRKGFMEFEDFLKHFEPLTDYNVTFHMRIATHGAIDRFNCHPFIVTPDQAEAVKTWIDTDKPVFFHNGVLHGCGDKTKLSDSLDYATSILSGIPSLETKVKVLERESSRFAILQEEQTFLVGDWQKHEGFYTSNNSWKKWEWENKAKDTGYSYGSNYYLPKSREPYWYELIDDSDSKFATANDYREQAADIADRYPLSVFETTTRTDEDQCNFCGGVSYLGYLVEGCYLCPACLVNYADLLECSYEYNGLNA